MKWVMMLMITIGVALTAMAETHVTLVIEPYPPFALGEEGTVTTTGVAVKVAHEIFRRIPEATLTVMLMPWKRLMEEVKTGRKDGV